MKGGSGIKYLSERLRISFSVIFSVSLCCRLQFIGVSLAQQRGAETSPIGRYHSFESYRLKKKRKFVCPQKIFSCPCLNLCLWRSTEVKMIFIGTKKKKKKRKRCQPWCRPAANGTSFYWGAGERWIEKYEINHGLVDATELYFFFFKFIPIFPGRAGAIRRIFVEFYSEWSSDGW